jgi:hypothetical protein
VTLLPLGITALVGSTVGSLGRGMWHPRVSLAVHFLGRQHTHPSPWYIIHPRTHPHPQTQFIIYQYITLNKFKQRNSAIRHRYYLQSDHSNTFTAMSRKSITPGDVLDFIINNNYESRDILRNLQGTCMGERFALP